MRRLSSTISVVSLASLIVLFETNLAHGASVSLPIHTIKEASSDLLDEQGKPIDPNQAAALARRGSDLSLLDPIPSKLWQNASYSAEDISPDLFPPAGGTVRFIADEAVGNKFTYLARVEEGGRAYRLGISRFTHAVLFRAALLRKLGYYIPTPKHYQKLTVQFSSLEQLDKFLNTAQEDAGDFESRKWAVVNKESLTVTLSSATLEPSVSDFFDIHWGFFPDPAYPRAAALLSQLSRFRPYRALIVPVVLTDIPETPNRYSPKVGAIFSDNVVLTHDSARSFSAATIEDARWLVRRIAKLSEQDWIEIVTAARLPPEIDQLVYAKLIHRVHNLLELFSIKPVNPHFPAGKPDLRFSTPSGLIKDGKVTREFIDGYPQRWSHYDPTSPFSTADLFRYLKIDLQSTAIKAAIERMQKIFAPLGVQGLAENRAEEIQKRIRDHIATNPTQPLYQPVESWGGPFGNVNVQASRHVSTGTYFESTAPIQLVDHLSMGIDIGYFRALDGISGAFPSGGGNLSVLRDYTHIRPIDSIKASTKESWKDVLVSNYMMGLSDILISNDPSKGPPVDQFLRTMREGEVFNISDTIAIGLFLQNTSPLNALLSLGQLNFINTLALGANTSRVILKQTTITRTADGLQIFIRDIGNTAANLQFDLNYFLNLLRISSGALKSEVNTAAYVIDYQPSFIEETPTDSPSPSPSQLPAPAPSPSPSPEEPQSEQDKLRNDLNITLRALFKDNNPEFLTARFPHRRFKLKHLLDTSSQDLRFLTERASHYSESHEMHLQYPANPDHPELDPQDSEVILYSRRQGKLVGRDYFGFILDALEAFFKRVGFMDRATSPNPANIPFGKAHWKIISSETDLTPSGETLPSVGILQKVWGGWHMNRKDFLKLLDQVNNEFKDVSLGTHRVIESEAFSNAKAIDFYRIGSNLSIMEPGLNRLRDLLLQPSGSSGSPQEFFSGILERFFSKITSSGERDLEGDRKFYSDLMMILGNGDAKAGSQLYIKECQAEKERENPDSSLWFQGTWMYGNYYDCLSPWVLKLLKLRRSYPKDDKKAQADWMAELLGVLEEHVQLPLLLRYIEQSNYLFMVQISGFRPGDEDGDLQFFSNTSGDPTKDFEVSNGLFQLYARKTRILPFEVDRTNGGFR